MLAALLFLANPSTNPVGKDLESQAAIRIFREGCVEGSLKISPGSAEIVKSNKVPDFWDLYTWGGELINQKYIRFNYPSNTFIYFAGTPNSKPHEFASVCSLASQVVKKDDATRMFLSISAGKYPRQSRFGDWEDEWVLDLREHGYRARMKFRENHWIIMEVDTYAGASGR